MDAPDREPAPPPSGVQIAPGVFVPAEALRFAASRSSGPGGQNVNKVSTRIELRVALADLPIPPAAADRLRRLAGRKVTESGDLVIAADEHRSQARNKGEAMDRLRELVVHALVKPRVRRATKPTKSSQRRRVDEKKQRGQTKSNRRASGSED